MVVPLSTTAKNYDCPKCKAKVGSKCRSPSGKICDYPHKERFAQLTSSDIKNSEGKNINLPDLLKRTLLM